MAKIIIDHYNGKFHIQCHCCFSTLTFHIKDFFYSFFGPPNNMLLCTACYKQIPYSSKKLEQYWKKKFSIVD